MVHNHETSQKLKSLILRCFMIIQSPLLPLAKRKIMDSRFYNVFKASMFDKLTSEANLHNSKK